MNPRFVSGDMFLEYTGVNLSDKLRNSDNPSDQVNAFLFRVETRLMKWVDKYGFRVVSWNDLTPYQVTSFQFAILDQAYYMWKNGDIAMDSGYDQESGQTADPHILEEITVCKPAIESLLNSGILNLKIKNRKRFMSGDTFGITSTRKRTSGPAYPTMPGNGSGPAPQINTRVLYGIGYTEEEDDNNG